MSFGFIFISAWKLEDTHHSSQRSRGNLNSKEKRCFAWHHHFNQLGFNWMMKCDGSSSGKKNREVKWTFLLHYDIGGVARLPPSLIGDLSGNNGATAIKRNTVALTVVGPLIMTTSVWVNWNSFFFIHYTSSICMFHLIWQAKAKSGFPIDKHPTILKMMPLWLDLLLFHTIYDIIIQSQTCHESIQPCMWKRKKSRPTSFTLIF